MTMNYEEVKKDFLSGKIKGCKTYFENNNYYVEAGYCCIVLDELDKAKELFQKVQEVDTRAKWGLILLQMIKGDILTFPTYFQIRNFLELDLSILILYCKGEYVEKSSDMQILWLITIRSVTNLSVGRFGQII